MDYKNKMAAASGQITISTFGGINRRIRAGAGEFADMENLSYDQYPCIRSAKQPIDMGFELPEGVEAVKLIIPKRLNEEITGFSGVVYNRNYNWYEIYINGEMRQQGISEYTDAVDYNGTIIVLPSLTGECYAKKAAPGEITTIRNYSYRGDVAFSGSGLQIKCSGYEYETWIQSKFQAGDEIIISGLRGDFEANNTIYPETSLDHSNTTSPVSIKIVSMSFSGGYNYSGTGEIQVEIRNSQGAVINWPYISASDYTSCIISKKQPRSTYGCVAHNRLWLSLYNGEEILASELGKPLSFYEFQGTDADSWSGSVGTPGKFTGIASWQNRVVLFKPDIIHVVYGSLPSSFGIEKTYAAGCIDSRSIATAGGKLIWLYYDGFYEFSGSRPRRISDKLCTKYVSCSAFSDGVRYYAQCEKEDGGKEFVIYDTELGLWSKLASLDLVSGDWQGGKVYVCDKKRMYCLYQGEPGDFFAETPELTFDSFDDKSLIYASVRCKIHSGFLNIYTSVNGGEWISHKGISKSGKHRLPIRYNPGDTIRLRLEGSGDVCITELNMEVLIKKR